MKSLFIVFIVLLSYNLRASTSSRAEVVRQLILSEDARLKFNATHSQTWDMTDLQRELAQIPTFSGNDIKAYKKDILERIIIIKLAMYAHAFPIAAQKLFLETYPTKESFEDKDFSVALQSLKDRITNLSFPKKRQGEYFRPGLSCMYLFWE